MIIFLKMIVLYSSFLSPLHAFQSNSPCGVSDFARLHRRTADHPFDSADPDPSSAYSPTTFPAPKYPATPTAKACPFFLANPRPTLAVSPEDVEVRYSRSGGSGGQNVNKVSTKAEVRFSLTRAESWVPRSVLRKLAEREASRVNKENVLVVTSSAHRTQAANKQDAMGKLQSFLSSAARAAKPPKPPSAIKVKRIKSLSRKAERRRADFKKHTSEKKHLRRQKYGPE